jgi:hypothetical protein
MQSEHENNSNQTPTETGSKKDDIRLGKLNWGALVFTPLWLARNGFWIPAILYVISAILYFPVAIIIAVVFFIKGTEWSWGDGTRWNNYEEFRFSQNTWNNAGLIGLAVALLLGLAILVFKIPIR